MTHGHEQGGGDCLRESDGGELGRGEQRGKNWDNCNDMNNKIFFKITFLKAI